MNFLDLARQNASTTGSDSSSTTNPTSSTPGSESSSQPVAEGNLFGISAQDFERRQAQVTETQKIQSIAAAKPVEPKPAQSFISASSAQERRKDGSQIDKGMQDGIYLLSFRGEFDETNVDKEFERVEKFFGTLPYKLAIFDFREVQYINSKTMGYIADWYQRFTDVGGEISIAHGGAVVDSLEACGITQLIPVMPQVSDSVTALRSKYPEHIREGVSLQHKDIPASATPKNIGNTGSVRPPSATELLATPTTPTASIQILPSTSVVQSASVAPVAPTVSVSPVAPEIPSVQSPVHIVNTPLVSEVKIEQASPIASPSGIRDSDGKTFVFYEKTSTASPLAPAEPPAAISMIQVAPTASPTPAINTIGPESFRPNIQEIISGVGEQAEGVTLENAHEIVARALPEVEEDSEQDLLVAAQEFGGLVAEKIKTPVRAAVPPVAPVVSPSTPQAVVPQKSVAPRSRKKRKLFVAFAVVAVAGLAAFQYASPTGVSDILSYFGKSSQESVESPAPVVTKKRTTPAAAANRPRVRRVAPAVSAPTSTGMVQSGTVAPSPLNSVKK